jgi:hypothetical protein
MRAVMPMLFLMKTETFSAWALRPDQPVVG